MYVNSLPIRSPKPFLSKENLQRVTLGKPGSKESVNQTKQNKKAEGTESETVRRKYRCKKRPVPKGKWRRLWGPPASPSWNLQGQCPSRLAALTAGGGDERAPGAGGVSSAHSCQPGTAAEDSSRLGLRIHILAGRAEAFPAHEGHATPRAGRDAGPCTLGLRGPSESPARSGHKGATVPSRQQPGRRPRRGARRRLPQARRPQARAPAPAPPSRPRGRRARPGAQGGTRGAGASRPTKRVGDKEPGTAPPSKQKLPQASPDLKHGNRATAALSGRPTQPPASRGPRTHGPRPPQPPVLPDRAAPVPTPAAPWTAAHARLRRAAMPLRGGSAAEGRKCPVGPPSRELLPTSLRCALRAAGGASRGGVAGAEGRRLPGNTEG